MSSTSIIMIDCSMCKEETKHMELDWFPVRDPRRFKCYSCGEYNMQKTIADGIMEPVELAWKSLHRLETDTHETPVAQKRVATIAGELEAAIAVVRRSVESLLEATMGPEDDEDAPVPGGENYTLVNPDKNQSFLRYGFNPGAGCDVPASSWEAFPEEFAEPTRYDVGGASEEDYTDLLYMTSPRDDGKEK